MNNSFSDLSREDLVKKLLENENNLKIIDDKLKSVEENNLIYKDLFNCSPTPMWEEDITDLMKYLRKLKKDGVENIEYYFDSNPAEVEKCIKKIKVINVNAATLKLHEAESKEHLIENLSNIFTKKSHEAFKKEIIAIANGDLEFEGETDAKTLNGSIVTIKLYLKIIERANNNELQYIALISTIDITKQKITESKLEDSLIKYKSIFNNINISITHIDKNGFITDINDYHLNDIGKGKYSKDQFIGTNVLQRPSIQKAGVKENYKDLLDGKSFRLNNVFFPSTTGGSPEYFNMTGIPIFINDQFESAIVVAEKITDKVQGKIELKKTEERFRLALEGADIGFWDHNLLTNKIWRNDRWYRMLGYQKDQIGDDFNTFYELLHPKDFERTRKAVDLLLNKKTDEFRIEQRLKDITGQYKWILNWGKVIEYSEDGRPARAAGVHLDITDRKLAEEKEKSIFESYNQIFNSSIDAIYVLDHEGMFLEVNSAAEQMYGYSQAEFLGKTPEFLSAPGKNDMDQVIQYLNRAYNGEKIEFDFWGLRSNGETFPKIVRLNSILYRGNKAIVAFGLDITDRYQAEQMIKESNEKYSTLVEQANEGIVINQDWKIKYCNKYLIDILGYTEDELLESSIDKYMPAEFGEESRKMFENRIEEEEVSSVYESKAVTKSGKIIPIEINAKRIIFKGKPAVQSIIRDITERKEAELQIMQTKEQLQFAIDGSGAGLWDWYVQTDRCIFSERWAEIIGYKLSELEPVSIETWNKFVHPDDLLLSTNLIEEYFEGKTKEYICEARMKHKNGDWIWVLDRGKAVEWDRNGKPLRMVGTHIDITHSKKIEEALRKSEQKYRLLVENQTDLIVEVNNQNKFTFVSNSYCKMFGKSESELLGNSFFPLIHEEDREATMQEMEKLKTPPFTCRIEQRAMTIYGWRWLEWNDRATFDSSDNLISVLGVGRDITDKKNAEHALRLSEEKFLKLFKYGPNLLLIIDIEDNKLMEINDRGLEILGLKKENILNKSTIELGIIDSNALNIIVNQMKGNGFIRDLEVPVKLPSGEDRIGLFNGQIISISGKNYAFHSITDITDRKRVEKDIEEKEENLREIVNTSGDAVVLLEKDGTIIETNNIFADLLNLKRNDLIGKNLFNESRVKIISERSEVFKRYLNSKKPKNMIGSGFGKTWEINIRPILNDLDEVSRIAIFGKDITEKYIFEEKLKQTNEKLRNLSRHMNFVREEERKNISREVHDNLGQKLTALNLEISWIKQNLPDDLSDIKNQFNDIMELVNQSIITVQEISTELRPGILDDLGLVNAIQWQCNKISRKSDLNFLLDLTNEEVDLTDEIKTILFRVFQEALTNIIRHSKAKNISVNLHVLNKKLIFEIIDDGIGIPPEKVNDFSSFGIIGMRERIDSINGSFYILEGKTKGTTIIITVPIAEVK